LGTEFGLAHPRESVGGRISVGSGPFGGKTEGPWRVPTGRESDRGSTCRWKALRNAEAEPLDGGTAEAVLTPSGFPGRSRVAFGAMGSVRGESAVRGAVENAAHGGYPWCSIPDGVGIVADAAEAEGATSIATFPGVGLPQGGPAPPRTWRPQADGREAVHVAQAARVGNRTVLG